MSTSRPHSSAEPVAFASPHEEALLTLMRSGDCLHRAMQQRLKPYGLTATQYNVLRILRKSQGNGLTCSTIGSRMVTPEPDITRLLTRLKAQRLVRQQRDLTDRRVVWTHITPEGLQILESLDEIIGEAPKELLHELSGEELRQLTRLLNKARCCGTSNQTGQSPPSIETATTAKLPLPRSAQSSLPHPHPE